MDWDGPPHDDLMAEVKVASDSQSSGSRRHLMAGAAHEMQEAVSRPRRQEVATARNAQFNSR